MSFSCNPHPAANVPIPPQRHLQPNTPSHILNNNSSHFFVGSGRQLPRDELTPDDMSLEVLNEKSRGFRVLLHSPTENVLIPFLQDVPWITENPRIVHGVNPSIECTGYFQRCFLCIQHSLSRSLPAAVRQKYLRHDHTYGSRQPEEKLLLVTQVALELIEKNYTDAFAKMISNADELTNPSKIFTRSGECKCDTLERRQTRVHFEDMEKILSSPWAKFDEVEIYSIPQTAVPAVSSEGMTTQPTINPRLQDEVPNDDTFFIVTRPRRESSSSRTNLVIEKYCSTRKPGCSNAPSCSSGETGSPSGHPQPTSPPIANSATELQLDRSNCGRPQTEPCPANSSRDVMSNVLQRVRNMSLTSNADPNATERLGPHTMHENPYIYPAARAFDRDNVQWVTRGREIDLKKLESRQETECSLTASRPPPPGPLPNKRSASNDTADAELQEDTKHKRFCQNDLLTPRNEVGWNRAAFRPSAAMNLFKPEARCTWSGENNPSRSTQWSHTAELPEAPARYDSLSQPICYKNCCSNSRTGSMKRMEYLPKSQIEPYNELLTSNRISAKCPTCGIIFRALGVAKATPYVMSYKSSLLRLRDHIALHRADVLNCVFPSCRDVAFDSREDLVAHMDAHRQMLIVAGVEQWENRMPGPLLLPRFSKPHLTCEICLIDFNWRTTLPGMLSHTERYSRHCEQHRIRMGEGDYRIWQCVFRGCEEKFISQPVLEEHMWTTHAVLCHCATCDWIVWGDTDEVCLHREKCTAQLTDVDHKQFGMRSSTKSASRASTPGSASRKCLGTPSQGPRSVSFTSSPLLRHRLKLLRNRAAKAGKPTPAKLDTASSANHLMRFSYYCDFCGAPFRSHHQKQYHSHVQSHLPDRQLTCVYGDCGRQFGSIQELHSHVKTKLSTCRYCGAVLFLNYKKHILTCRPLHEIKKQRLLKEEFAKVKYAPVQKEDLYWSDRKLYRSSPGSEQIMNVSESDGQECFLRNVNLVKGSFETIKAKTRRHEQLRSQIHVANGKGRRACTEKTSCAKCGRIFRNALNLREHLRGYHNARDF